MKIHIVTPSDTIYSISKQYGVPEVRLITDNYLDPQSKLLVGQTLIISRPCKTCSVRGGDTIETIAKEHNTTVLSLLQNNPQVFNQKLIPSQTLNLSYDKEDAHQIAVAAYTGTSSTKEIEKYLPNISILSVQNHAFINGSEVNVLKSAYEFASLAKKYRAIPILVIECVNDRGSFDGNCIANVLGSPSEIELLINNIINAVESNGYSGVELNATGLNNSDEYKFVDFFLALSGRCRDKNLQCIYPMIPIEDLSKTDDNLMDISDYIPLWSYIWDDIIKASAPAPIQNFDALLRNHILNKYYSKLLLGIPAFGVDYTKVNGNYRKNVVQHNEVLKRIRGFSNYRLKRSGGMPYIEYEERGRKNGLDHIMHFEDAATLSEKLDLVDKYGLYGINIMSLDYDTPILWKILNQRYKILKF